MAKKFYAIDAYGRFLVERVISLPSHSASDEGRLIYNTISDKFYIGGGSGWIRIVLDDGDVYTNLFAAAESSKYASAVPPVADFSAPAPLQGITPVTKTFTNLTTGYYTALEWDFDNDGIIESTDENPTYTFVTPGTYDVRLTALAPVLDSTAVKISYITVYHPLPAPDFSATPTVGDAPLNVSFTDLTTGVVKAYYWDFDNDGSIDSVLANPSYNYTTPGTYSVKLTVAADNGSLVDELKTNYITVYYPPPVANFTASPTVGPAPLLVSFTNLTNDQGFPGISYEWDFNYNTGVDSTLVNPTNNYTTPGTYSVKLRAIGDGPNEDTEIKSNYITVVVACSELTFNRAMMAFGRNGTAPSYQDSTWDPFTLTITLITGGYVSLGLPQAGIASFLYTFTQFFLSNSACYHMTGGRGSGNPITISNRNCYWNRLFDNWVIATTAPVSREYAGGAQIYRSGSLQRGYLYGGNDSTLVAKNTHYEYDPNTGSYFLRASSNSRTRHFFTEINDNVSFFSSGTLTNNYAPGTSAPYSFTATYDADVNSWTTRTSITTPRISGSAGSRNCQAHCIGGSTISRAALYATNRNERFDLQFGTWTSRAVDPLWPPANETAGSDTAGSIGVSGGESSSTNKHRRVYRYDPNTNAWATGGQILNAGKNEHSQTRHR